MRELRVRGSSETLRFELPFVKGLRLFLAPRLPSAMRVSKEAPKSSSASSRSASFSASEARGSLS